MHFGNNRIKVSMFMGTFFIYNAEKKQHEYFSLSRKKNLRMLIIGPLSASMGARFYIVFLYLYSYLMTSFVLVKLTLSMNRKE